MANIFKRYKIGYLFFFSFASFIIVVLGITVWVSYRMTSHEIIKTTSYYQQQILDGLNKQVSLQLKAVESVSLAVSRNQELEKFVNTPADQDSYTYFRHTTEMKKTLSNFIFSMPTIDSIFLYMENPPNNDYQYPVKFYPLQQAAKEDWFPRVKRSDFSWIGERDVQNNGRKSIISFARKIYSPTGEMKAIILFNVQSDLLKKLLVEDEAANTNRILFDSGGRKMTFTGTPYMDTEKLMAMAQKVSLSTDQNTYVNEPYLVVWSKPLNSNWLLAEVTPRSELTTGSQKVSIYILLIGVGFIVLAILFTFFLTRQFTTPIYLLVRRMKDFSGFGGYSPAPVDYDNEFGDLFLGYENLMERTQNLYHSLKVQHYRKRKAEIRALQAMINPHFVYNTLDQINWLAIGAGQHQISKLLELTGRILRIGLARGETMIKIREELDFLSYYVEIQKVHFGDGFTFLLDAPERVLDYYIPKFTLQPIVENSIHHGFHGRETGTVSIDIQEKDDTIVWFISDNGNGFRDQSMAGHKRGASTGGYGLHNVKERLAIHFGSLSEFHIQNTGAGVTVKLIIPKIKHKQQEEELSHVESSYY